MINWPAVATNSIWIVGLSVLLAAIGYQDWLADKEDQAFGHRYSDPKFRAVLAGGASMFCLGLAGAGGIWWLTVVWILLGVWGWRAWRLGRMERS